MEDEAQRKNTDCVYFLASPLTCKKGSNCEFRHSEVARMNPRDCRFWLTGNCLNANCSFRHPPLDGRPGANVAAASTVSVSLSGSLPMVSGTTLVSKSKTPCYFYSQGFCCKGDKCTFMHGFTVEMAAQQKPPKVPLSKGTELSSKPPLMKNWGTPELQGSISALVPQRMTTPGPCITGDSLQQMPMTADHIGNTRMQKKLVHPAVTRQHTEEGKVKRASLSSDRMRDCSAWPNVGNHSPQPAQEQLQEMLLSVTDNKGAKDLVSKSRKRNGYVTENDPSSGFRNGESNHSIGKEHESKGHAVLAESQYEPQPRNQDYKATTIHQGDPDLRGVYNFLGKQQDDFSKGRSNGRGRHGKLPEQEQIGVDSDLRDHLTKRRRNDMVIHPTSADSYQKILLDASSINQMQNSYLTRQEGSSQRARLDHRIGGRVDAGLKSVHHDSGLDQEGTGTKRTASRISSNRQMINGQTSFDSKEELPPRVRSYLAVKGKMEERDIKAFTGPKSLAQIKAEKKGESTENLKQADSKSVVIDAYSREHKEGLLAGSLKSRANNEAASTLDFKGPKSLSLILEEKRKHGETMKMKNSNQTYVGSSSLQTVKVDKVDVAPTDMRKDVEEGEVVPDIFADGDEDTQKAGPLLDEEMDQRDKKHEIRPLLDEDIEDEDEKDADCSVGRDEEMHEDDDAKQAFETPPQGNLMFGHQMTSEEEIVNDGLPFSDDVPADYLEAGDDISGDEYDIEMEEADDENDFAKKLDGIFS